MNYSQDRRIRVAVVFGGRSSEHEISCVTAGGVLAALDPRRYEVLPIGITTSGRWVLTTADPERLAIHGSTMPTVDDEGGTVVLPGRGELAVQSPGEVPHALGTVDVVFPLLHGPYGEDGTIQGLLELADVRYVGSGVLASAVGMDKHVMKLLLAGAGLPVTRHVLVRPSAWEPQRDRVIAEAEAFGYPVFVKPARAGSSMGVSKARDAAELEAAVLAAREHDPKVLIEEAVTGREVECGVLEGQGGGEPEASVVGEIRLGAGHELYDFEAKYLPGDDVSLDIPADLPAEVAERVRRMSIEAFQALSCESLARVDFFLRDDGSLVVNELNTMPGFTPTSMFPQLWAKTGIDYPSLVDRLVDTALRRPTGLR
ncbi:D-alanine--D-alanine ligase family protein [Jiangella sp. DSM 45060]|uniref:D-alanine--D-alanine ligase family protein n=1 Tax=Jiangella sp. DSM 45060 TaxID=1798224 RepID=UPI00087B281C|nr:D-alanine--D-alanine ligase family protein [Jiangella sp. DSM 45060]SDS63296.1 D-alanine--D-alanine ligase [Jiangella sp. DSM 45060]